MSHFLLGQFWPIFRDELLDLGGVPFKNPLNFAAFLKSKTHLPPIFRGVNSVLRVGYTAVHPGKFTAGSPKNHPAT